MDRSCPAPRAAPAPTVVVVEGDLDLATAPALRQRLQDACTFPDRVLIVDLSAVTFIDCAGLRPLEDAQRELVDRLQLRAASPAVLRLLRLAELADLFHHINAEPPDNAAARTARPQAVVPAAGARDAASRDRRYGADGPGDGAAAADRRTNLTAVGQVCVAYLQSGTPLDLWLLTALEDGGQVVLASAGPWAVDLGFGTVLPWIGSFALHMAAGTAPPVAPRTADIPRYAAATIGRWTSVSAYTGIPITREDGELVATLSGFSTEPDHPSVTQTRALLDLIRTSLTTTATVENAHHQALDALARADLLAESDALTELRNRRGWYSALVRETERCTRYSTSAGIVSIDLDELKAVNDEHGHDVGDTLLQSTARVLTRACRPSDVVARPGGDEFAVLAVEVDDEAVERLTGRIVEQLRTAGIAASAGGATRAIGENLWDTWVRADRHMYAQKRARTAVRNPRQAAT